MFARPGHTDPRIGCSLIVAVFESYEIVVRQCRHLKQILPDDWELILLDDGSLPPIPGPTGRPKNFTLVHTRNTLPWTQPIARNLGARLARGQYLFFTDIDHIVSGEAVTAVNAFRGSRLLFTRSFAVLDDAGELCRDRTVLQQSGWTEAADKNLESRERIHQNTFAIRRELFLDAMQGGYDETLCAEGKYGGDDVEFNERYARLVFSRQVEPDELGPEIYVYPDPAANPQFHSLARA